MLCDRVCTGAGVRGRAGLGLYPPPPPQWSAEPQKMKQIRFWSLKCRYEKLLIGVV